jgi:hypothetical protein
MGAKSAYKDFTHARKLMGLESFQATPGKFLKVGIRHDSLGTERESYPDVLYEYFVDGKSIWGWRLSYEEEPKPAAYWKDRLKGYSQGSAVTVHYNPMEPKDSILEKKRDGLTRILLKTGLGGIFLLAGLLLAYLPASNWLAKLLIRR